VQAHHIQEKQVTSIYILEGGPDASRCQVNQTTGACSIRQGVSLADKGNSTIEIDVKEVVIDGATAGATNTVRVVAAVAPAPLALAAVSITINESPLPGISLGQLVASGGTATYTYSAGAGNNGSISVSASGELTTASSLGALATPSIWRYSTSPSFTFPVSVSDGATTATATVTVSLNQVATAPAATNASISISEALTTGTAIASPTNFGITAADFTLATISGDSSFLIHPTTGVITLNRALDALDINSFSRFVTFAKDVNGQALSSSPSLTIAIQIANRAPTIGITGAVTSLPEATSTTSAVVVGTITITEIDGGQGTNVLAISGADAASFELGTPTTAGAVTSYPLRLKAGTDLDFTVKTSYSITITSSDAALPGQNKTLNYSLAITNSNVAPTAPATASFSVPDNRTIGSVVGTITVTDPGDTITASVQTDDLTSPGVFAVANNGQITVAQTIPIASTQGTHSQVIRWTDSRGAFSQTTVTYNITASTRIVNATYSVDEDEPIGFTIATLPATFGGNILTYAITAGDSGNQFTFDGNVLEVASALDFETNETHTLTVTATETGGTNTATITINVNDISEPAVAPTISGGPFTVSENQPIGTTVGTLTFTRGNDPGATISLAMNGAGGPIRFAINNSGVITTTEVLDYESATSQNVTATITNSHSSASVNFTISTGNLTNEFIFSNPGSFVIPSTSLEVSGGTIVGTAQVLSTGLLDATATGPTNSEILFTVSAATACRFRVNGTAATTFTRQQLGAGLVTFVALTTATAGNYFNTIDQLSPVFTLTVSDTGTTGVSSKATTITPIFTSEFTANNILDAGVISNTELRAISIGDTATETEMVLSGSISGGQFERVATPGTAITTWTQAEINAGAISLIQTGATTITNLRARGSNGYLGTGVNDTIPNTAPTAISFSPASPSFLSTIAAATVISTATATDPESTAGGSYSLGGANAALWSINNSGVISRSASGSLTVGASSLSVTFTDNGGETFSETLNFTVLEPASISLAAATATVGPIAAGSNAGQLLTTITAPVGSALSLSGTGAAKFATSGLTQLRTAPGQDLVDGQTYNVTVTATLNGTTATATFALTTQATTISLSPTSSSITAVSAGSNAGEAVSTIAATAGATLALSGTDAAKFALSGNQLRTAPGQDLADGQTYNVTVTATANGHPASANFALSATSGVVLSTTLSQYSYTGARLANTALTLATVTSPPGSTLSVINSATSTATTQFAVSGGSLIANAFGGPAVGTHTVFVRANLGGTNYDSPIFTFIQQTAPTVALGATITGFAYPTAAIDNTTDKTLIPTIAFTPSSPAPTLGVTGANASKFAIVGSSLRTALNTEFLARESYVCQATATLNNATAISSTSFTLTIRDAAGPTGAVTLSQNTLTAARPASGFLHLTHVTASLNAALTIVVVSGGSSAANYTIVGSQVRTTVGSAPSAAGSTTHTFRVRATEAGTGTIVDSELYTLVMLQTPTVSFSANPVNTAALAAGSNPGTASLATVTFAPSGATLALTGADASRFQLVSLTATTASLRSVANVDLVAANTYVCNVTVTANSLTTTSSRFSLGIAAPAGPSGSVTLSQSSFSGSVPTTTAVETMTYVTFSSGTLAIVDFASTTTGATGNFSISGTRIVTSSISPPPAGVHTFKIRATETGGAQFTSETFTATFT
jgi:trimeric autotransporter adhesin